MSKDFSLLDGIDSLDAVTLSKLIDVLTALHEETIHRQETVLNRLRQKLESKSNPYQIGVGIKQEKRTFSEKMKPAHEVASKKHIGKLMR